MKRKPITVAFRAFCLSLLFVMSAFAAAQAAKPMKLTGRVVDPDGFSLVGVTITIKGTTKGVTTDSEGKYELDVNAEDIVVYSYIGYKTQEILAKEAEQAQRLRRQQAQILGEQASTRLLFPMILMLLVVFVILLVPAWLTFAV